MLEFNKEYSLKVLCNELGWELKNGGKQTKNAISKIENDYVLEKIGKKYIVERELTEYEKIEKQKYNKAKEVLEPIVYNALLQSKENIIVKSIPELAREMCLVNDNYYNISHLEEGIFNLPFDIETELNYLFIFLNETSPVISKMIDDILNDMESRSLVLWNKELWYGRFRYYYAGKERRRLTDTFKCEDEPKFLETQRKVWDKWGIEKEKDIYKLYKNDDIRKIKNSIRSDIANELDISYYFYKRHISMYKQGIKNRLTQLEYKKLANEYSYDKLLNSQQGALKYIEDDLKRRIANFSIKIDFDRESK